MGGGGVASPGGSLGADAFFGPAQAEVTPAGYYGGDAGENIYVEPGGGILDTATINTSGGGLGGEPDVTVSSPISTNATSTNAVTGITSVHG